jgi:hypothetical protein
MALFYTYIVPYIDFEDEIDMLLEKSHQCLTALNSLILDCIYTIDTVCVLINTTS